MIQGWARSSAVAAFATLAIISSADAFAPSTIAGAPMGSLARSSVAAQRGAARSAALSLTMKSEDAQKLSKRQRLARAAVSAAASLALFTGAGSVSAEALRGPDSPTAALVRAATGDAKPVSDSRVVVASGTAEGFVPMSKKDLLKLKVPETEHHHKSMLTKKLGAFIVWIFPAVLVLLPIYFVFPWEILTGYNKDDQGNKRKFIK